jgi:superoxide dismutase, Fe-Mn family
MDKLSLYQSAYMNYPYSLPPLVYAYAALEPHIDEQTMHLHHDKHHQAYIDHANEAVGKYPELQKTPRRLTVDRRSFCDPANL